MNAKMRCRSQINEIFSRTQNSDRSLLVSSTAIDNDNVRPN